MRCVARSKGCANSHRHCGISTLIYRMSAQLTKTVPPRSDLTVLAISWSMTRTCAKSSRHLEKLAPAPAGQLPPSHSGITPFHLESPSVSRDKGSGRFTHDVLSHGAT